MADNIMTINPDTEETVVEITGLTKIFTDFWRRPSIKAVDNIDLAIKRGEIFGLLGPNGSGKSTTIKMLLGLLHPTAGKISVFGKSSRDVAVKNRIGYLPEESYLYNHLTPYETLHFYAKLFNIDSKTRSERIEQLIDMVNLSNSAHRPIGEFSKGMARRAGLAQALINNPELIILDEPTAGLDPIGCRQVKDLILFLAQNGKTILLSSHLLADVEDVCDRIAILFNGTIRASGRVEELLTKDDIIRFSASGLNPETITNVSSLLKNATGKEPVVDHPSVNLENFFVNVVEKAQGKQKPDKLAPAKFLAGNRKKELTSE